LRLDKSKADVGMAGLSRRHDMRDRDFGMNHGEERRKVSANNDAFLWTNEPRKRNAYTKPAFRNIDHGSFTKFDKRSRSAESRAWREVKRNGHSVKQATLLMHERRWNRDAVAVPLHRAFARTPPTDHLNIAVVEPAVGSDRKMQRFASNQFATRWAVVRATDDKRCVFQLFNMSRKWAWECNAVECSDADRCRAKRGSPKNRTDRRDIRVIRAKKRGHALEPQPHIGAIGAIRRRLQRDARAELANFATPRQKSSSLALCSEVRKAIFAMKNLPQPTAAAPILALAVITVTVNLAVISGFDRTALAQNCPNLPPVTLVETEACGSDSNGGCATGTGFTTLAVGDVLAGTHEIQLRLANLSSSVPCGSSQSAYRLQLSAVPAACTTFAGSCEGSGGEVIASTPTWVPSGNMISCVGTSGGTQDAFYFKWFSGLNSGTLECLDIAMTNTGLDAPVLLQLVRDPNGGPPGNGGFLEPIAEREFIVPKCGWTTIRWTLDEPLCLDGFSGDLMLVAYCAPHPTGGRLHPAGNATSAETTPTWITAVQCGVPLAADADTVVAGTSVAWPVRLRGTFSVPCPAPCAADLDGNGDVGAADLSLVLASWGNPKSGADLDGDGDVARLRNAHTVDPEFLTGQQYAIDRAHKRKRATAVPKTVGHLQRHSANDLTIELPHLRETHARTSVDRDIHETAELAERHEQVVLGAARSGEIKTHCNVVHIQPLVDIARRATLYDLRGVASAPAVAIDDWIELRQHAVRRDGVAAHECRAERHIIPARSIGTNFAADACERDHCGGERNDARTSDEREGREARHGCHPYCHSSGLSLRSTERRRRAKRCGRHTPPILGLSIGDPRSSFGSGRHTALWSVSNTRHPFDAVR